jgi:hypothetical protein
MKFARLYAGDVSALKQLQQMLEERKFAYKATNIRTMIKLNEFGG